MNLLIEQLQPGEANIVTESSTDGKKMWISGIFMQAQIRNRNNRVYPINEISNAVNLAKQRIVETNGIFGEIDHPQNLTINLDRVSHVITELWMQGDHAYGKARLLDTPMGKIGQELFKSGVKVGVSSRGAGNVNESGEVNGFNFITVDIVATPSAMQAYPGSIYESLEASKSGNKIMTLAEQVCQDTDAQKYFQKEILKWISDMNFSKR